MPASSQSNDRPLGRSRGSLRTKIHLASDARVRPLALRVTASQTNDAAAFEAVMAAIRVPGGRPAGRPKTRPDTVLTDRAFCSARCMSAPHCSLSVR
ncbi:transposase [Streptomyces gardneri]|uniref:transposase n=1 Tax=Streptomyces gardneri TaxID=66892 RepID=UPI0036A5DAB2